MTAFYGWVKWVNQDAPPWELDLGALKTGGIMDRQRAYGAPTHVRNALQDRWSINSHWKHYR